jgi:hypothetical protein
MSCQGYKDAIADAAFALPGEEARLAPEVATHLSECAACRDELEAQRALAAAIDRGVAASVSGAPSPGFAARVRARVAEETASPQRWFWRWAPVAMGALAVVALMVWVSGTPPVQPPVGLAPPQLARGGVILSVAPNAADNAGLDRTDLSKRNRAVQRPTQREPEVLVLPGQDLAIAQLYLAAQSGRLDGAALLREPPAVVEAPNPLENTDLRIAPIEITPLIAEKGTSPAPGR